MPLIQAAKSILLLALLLSSSTALTQILTNDSSALNIAFNLSLTGITTEYPFSHDISIDRYLNASRRNNSYYTGMLTDQPHEHGSIGVQFSARTTFKENYKLYTNLLLEHRGESYGANDLNNIVVLPLIYGRMRDTFRLSDQAVEVFAHVGDLIQFRQNEGLQVYNIDVQGVILRLKWKDYFFRIDHLPDVSKGIGLALEELFSFAIGIEKPKWQTRFSYDLNSNYVGHADYQTHLSVSGRYLFSKSNKLYAQIGTRKFNDNFSSSNSALLIGADWKLDRPRLKLKLQPEFRYYTRNYNWRYYNQEVAYRDINNPQIYSNTVGRYLYPLKNYYYPYSQWAVFTEYRNTDVLGLSLLADLDLKISKNWGSRLQFDLNSIHSDWVDYNYFFYTWEFYYEIIKGMRIGTLVTNKVINLDVHFQTFYMAKHPSIGLHIRKSMDTHW